jgi:hypothetical protein
VWAKLVAGLRGIHALLIVYQLLRTAMVDATDSRPGLDPDRASFTTALNAARDQLVHAAGVIAEPPSTWSASSANASWPTAARPTRPDEDPHDQTLELQISGPRTPDRPPHLQGHHQHRRHHQRPLTNQPSP